MITASTLASGLLSLFLGVLGNALQGVLLGLIDRFQTRSDQIAVGAASEAGAQAKAGAEIDARVQAEADRAISRDALIKALKDGAG